MLYNEINLTVVFNYIIDTLSRIFEFVVHYLNFRIGDHVFNLLEFSIGVYFAAESITYFFGDNMEE